MTISLLLNPNWQISYQPFSVIILDFMNRSDSPDSSFAFNLVTPTEAELEILRIPINKSYGLYSRPT